jgi:hypothetical protein
MQKLYQKLFGNGEEVKEFRDVHFGTFSIRYRTLELTRGIFMWYVKQGKGDIMSLRKNSAVVILGTVLFCLSAAFPFPAQETDYKPLLGEWDVQTEDGQYTFVFVFSMEGETLKGLFKGTTGDYEMKNLSFEDKELQFSVTIDAGGQTMTIDYSAEIEGDSLVGYLSMEYGEANITGKKRE